MEVVAKNALLTCAGETLTTFLTSISVMVKAQLYSAQDPIVVLMTNGPKGNGDHSIDSQSKLVDAGEDNGDDDNNDASNGDAGLGGEDELASEEGEEYGKNPDSNGKSNDGPEGGGGGGAGEENGEEEDDDDHDNDDDDDDEGDEDEDGNEEEEEEDDDDEEEEDLQPPKKRKK